MNPKHTICRHLVIKIICHTHVAILPQNTICRQGSNSLAESEGRGLHLCPVRLRKLTWVVGVNPVTRYYALLRHCQRQGRAFEAQTKWLMHRLKVLLCVVDDGGYCLVVQLVDMDGDDCELTK